MTQFPTPQVTQFLSHPPLPESAPVVCCRCCPAAPPTFSTHHRHLHCHHHPCHHCRRHLQRLPHSAQPPSLESTPRSQPSCCIVYSSSAEFTKKPYLFESGCLHQSPVVASSRTAQLCRAAAALSVVCLLFLLHLPFRQLGRVRRRRLTQVPRGLLTVCLLAMLITRALASTPWVQADRDSVILRAQYCQPVPEEHLQRMLGTSYDPSRMTNEDPRAAWKRSGNHDLGSTLEKSAFDSYYMEDDPAGGNNFNEDFVDIVADQSGTDGWFRGEPMDEGLGGRELDEDEAEVEDNFYQKKDVRGGKSSSLPELQDVRTRDRRPDPVQSDLYMKRRRRAIGRQPRDGSRDPAGVDDSSKRMKGSVGTLPLRLTLYGRNRKQRRKLKNKLRKKLDKFKNITLPWTCNLTKVWIHLREGYFPRFLTDGRCATNKCFYRLFNCVPIKYRIYLLKRDPDFCNPLPTVGANTTYEQRWSVVRYYATTGCNCEKPKE